MDGLRIRSQTSRGSWAGKVSRNVRNIRPMCKRDAHLAQSVSTRNVIKYENKPLFQVDTHSTHGNNSGDCGEGDPMKVATITTVGPTATATTMMIMLLATMMLPMSFYRLLSRKLHCNRE